MIFKIFVFVLCLAILSSASDPDENVSTPDLIRSKGYPVEEHDVTTEDGYILTMHRINRNADPKPVVFLQHGLLDSSSTWVVNFASQSLGFILADNNYDVWLGNMRGNRYCQRHIKYNTTQEEFWNFSIDQMAAFDIPAMINYTVSLTKQSKIFFFGHSQGAMVLFARLSSDMDLSSKIKLFLAVGPVVHLSNLIGPIKYVAEFGLDRWFELFGRKDFLPSNALTQDIADKLCGNFWIDEILCKSGINIISGPSDNLNTTRIPVYLSHYPAGTSTKTINHYSQLVVNKKFQMYDYGAHDNLIFYNQSTAPIYDIRKIQVPVALYTGGSDWLADLNDVNILRQSLPNIVDDYTVEGWDHSDLVWATNATLVYYKRMIQFMSKFK